MTLTNAVTSLRLARSSQSVFKFRQAPWQRRIILCLLFVQLYSSLFFHSHHDRWQACLYFIRWVRVCGISYPFRSTSSVFDTTTFADFFVQALSWALSNGLLAKSNLYFPCPSRSISSPFQPRFFVRLFPLFQISYLTHLRSFILFFPKYLICIDTMKPSFLVCIRCDEVGPPTKGHVQISDF
jgi:hypothetical protein